MVDIHIRANRATRGKSSWVREASNHRGATA